MGKKTNSSRSGKQSAVNITADNITADNNSAANINEETRLVDNDAHIANHTVSDTANNSLNHALNHAANHTVIHDAAHTVTKRVDPPGWGSGVTHAAAHDAAHDAAHTAAHDATHTKLQPGPDKKKRILQAAMDAFSQESFHQVRVDEIAVKAGVGKGTVYEYFDSKEQLFRETVKESTRVYIDIYSICRARDRTLWEKLSIIIGQHIQFMQKNTDMTRFIQEIHAHLMNEEKDWVIKKHMEKEKLLGEMFREAIEKDEIRELDEQIAARMFAGSLFSICTDIIFLGEIINEEEIIRKTLNILRYGLDSR